MMKPLDLDLILMGLSDKNLTFGKFVVLTIFRTETKSVNNSSKIASGLENQNGKFSKKNIFLENTIFQRCVNQSARLMVRIYASVFRRKIDGP